MKYMIKNKESLHLQHWDVNNLHGCAILQKLAVNDFEWIKILLNLIKFL